MRRYTLVCEEQQAERVQRLATEYGLTEQEVLRQLVDAGLETVEADGSPEGERAQGRRQ